MSTSSAYTIWTRIGQNDSDLFAMGRSQRDPALKLDWPQVFTWHNQNRVACRGRL